MNGLRKLVVVVSLLALMGHGAHATDDRPMRTVKDKRLQERINKAIRKGVEYLKKSQQADGSWTYDRLGRQVNAGTGGMTALALYALAASGVSERDKAIQAGLKWTEQNKEPYGKSGMFGNYSASLLVLALTRINETKYRTSIHRLAESLVKSQLPSDMWSYRVTGYANKGQPARSARGRGDNSNSQFAILAIWAAYSLTDFRVPKRTWQRIRDFYKKTQLKSGGWSYVAPQAGKTGKKRPRMGMGRPSMTAAGLVAYVYAMAALDGSEVALTDARQSKVAKAGLKALMRGNHDYADYYFAYAMERVGTVMDLPLKDWYLAGARQLCKDQRPDGSWRETRWRHGDSNHVYATSLALLFLSRSTLPPRRAAVTVREKFPDVSKPGQLKRAFDFYHAYKAADREKALHHFAKAGPAAIGHFIERLKDKREAIRVTAFELLTKLLAKRFFYEPTWPPSDREVMLGPIEKYWKTHGVALRWNAEQRRYALPQ